MMKEPDMVQAIRLNSIYALLTVGLFAPGAALADVGNQGGYYGHMWGGGFGGGFMGVGIMLLFWGVVIAAIVLIVRSLNDRGGRSGSGSRALDILKERLARGEIDPKEFEERRKALEAGSDA